MKAFGKRVDGPDMNSGMNWFRVTDVLQPDAKIPTSKVSEKTVVQETFLKPKLVCQWPNHLVLNVVTEAQNDHQRVKIIN